MSGSVTPKKPERLSARVVALGGGHGLHVTLSALRRVVDDLTGIVTVADNGGSSGRLRQEFGVLPPGDLRMALAALCSDDDWGQTWARVLQHRFSSDGELGGHVVGNVLITALWELLGENVLGLEWIGRLLAAEGRVLPMADVPLDIEATVRGLDPDAPDVLSTVRGQAQVAVTPGTITSIRLVPEHSPANPEAVAAVGSADWIFLGPGSWYTSVLPHLMVDELRDALTCTNAGVVVVLNLPGQEGETSGYTSADLLGALVERAPELRVHTVLADRETVQRAPEEAEALAGAVASAGGELVLDDLSMGDGTPRHDPIKLAAACARIIGRV
ncbi:gluconeogenesis factor YvcK family protein [Nocardioides daejeonensis]|uniref:gluconeogenesis factor YvcK family protein n=1 Tax=Nocardioides daejeonensis TaxID=1046556 RepID=UPI000D7424F8|nr:uridine diphosphate-N-acetylglucosamine-binding protein YvcK [Nocardioides daejeonensis]